MLTKRSIAPSLNTNQRVRLLVVKSTGAVLAGKKHRFSSTWSLEMADEGGSHSPQRSTWRPSHQRSFQNQKWKASWPWWALSPNTATHTRRRSSENTAQGLDGIYSQQLQQLPHLTSRRTHRRMKMNSCSETGRVSANWSCWNQRGTHIRSKCIPELLQPHLQGLLQEELRDIQKQAPKPLCQVCILLLCTSVQLLIVLIQWEKPQTTKHHKCGYQVWHVTFVFLLPRGKRGIASNNLHYASAKTNSNNNLRISVYTTDRNSKFRLLFPRKFWEIAKKKKS